MSVLTFMPEPVYQHVHGLCSNHSVATCSLHSSHGFAYIVHIYMYLHDYSTLDHCDKFCTFTLYTCIAIYTLLFSYCYIVHSGPTE